MTGGRPQGPPLRMALSMIECFSISYLLSLISYLRKWVIAVPHIQQLDAHVADLIAAGEVVERPASVVKELMENAIDAGADTVTVEIQHGGMSLIRVTDNGCGIAAGEAQTAFLRHATSKIRTEYDLEAIGTLGFRGEALAAIAAVSRVDLLSRAEEAQVGVSLELEGGVLLSQEEAGCPRGTTMVVRDLFYNTPARLKFMKKDSAEGAAVFAVVQRQALSHPEVSVKFLRDGKQELLTPGDGQLQSALYAVLGREMALGMTEVKGSGEEMEVAGFVSRPACCRGTRGYQHFFVNGRYVKSRAMMAALEEAYATQKMVGKFPGCVLHLTARLGSVDVNVHPTKQEVKFTNERRVFEAVYYAVRSALEGDTKRPAAVLPKPAPKDTVTPNQTRLSAGGQVHMTAGEYRSLAGGVMLSDWTRSAAVSAAPPIAQPQVRTVSPAPRTAERPAPAPFAVPAKKERPKETKRAEKPSPEPPAPAPAVPPVSAPPTEEIPWRLVGEAFKTYILVEQGDKLLLIDKHAAHERMHFDRLKAADYQPMTQRLLTPEVVTPPAEEGAALLEHTDLLARFGFGVEDFGGGALLVRECPDYLESGDLGATLSELAQTLLTAGRADPGSARDELMHTMACKAAIKGGQKNDPQELLRVAKAVMSGAVRCCPHGRPVAIELERRQLEHQFKRS